MRCIKSCPFSRLQVQSLGLNSPTSYYLPFLIQGVLCIKKVPILRVCILVDGGAMRKKVTLSQGLKFDFSTSYYLPFLIEGCWCTKKTCPFSRFQVQSMGLNSRLNIIYPFSSKGCYALKSCPFLGFEVQSQGLNSRLGEISIIKLSIFRVRIPNHHYWKGYMIKSSTFLGFEFERSLLIHRQVSTVWRFFINRSIQFQLTNENL